MSGRRRRKSKKGWSTRHDKIADEEAERMCQTPHPAFDVHESPQPKLNKERPYSDEGGEHGGVLGFGNKEVLDDAAALGFEGHGDVVFAVATVVNTVRINEI